MGLKASLIVLFVCAAAQAQTVLVINSTRTPVNVSAVGVTTVTFNGIAQPVTCTNCSGSSSGGGNVSLTQNTVLGATVTFNGAQPVTGTFWQGTQPVSLSVAPTTPVTGTFWPATQPVSLTQNTVLGATVTFNGTQNVSANVSNFPASQAVTGTFFQATQPISGNVAVLQPTVLGATVTFNGAQPVTGSFFQTTQPVSGNVAILQPTVIGATVTFNGAQPVSIASMPSTPVTGTFFQALQPVSLTQTSVVGATVTFNGAQPVTGTFFQATQPISGNTQLIQNTVLGATVTFNGTQNVSAAQSGTWTVQPGNTANTTAWKVDGSAVTQPVSGTFFQATQPISGTVTSNIGTLPTLTKGAQGATGISTQDLKDAGRNYVVLVTTSQTGAIAETLLLFGKTVQGTATAAQTNYTPTSGKTLRCTSASYGIRSGAAAVGFVKFALRHNTAGATTAASPIVYQFPEINTGNATSGSGAAISVPIPEGIEFYGNGTQTIGISQFAQAVTNLITFTLSCYEY